MLPQKPVKSCVKRNTLEGKDVSEALALLTSTCTSGASCVEVQNDPVCTAAQADLQAKVTSAQAYLSAKQDADLTAKAAGKKLFAAFKLVRAALSTYETAVNGVADGDAAIIQKAGVEARPEAPATPPPVEKVQKVTCSVGKNLKEAVLSWGKTPGAAVFTIEVNYDPQSPTSTWTSLGVTTRRTKLVTVPAQGGQFLARIRAMDSDGKTADWSDTVLATAR